MVKFGDSRFGLWRRCKSGSFNNSRFTFRVQVLNRASPESSTDLGPHEALEGMAIAVRAAPTSMSNAEMQMVHDGLKRHFHAMDLLDISRVPKHLLCHHLIHNTIPPETDSNDFGCFGINLQIRIRCSSLRTFFFEGFEFLVCSKFNHTQCGRTCACVVACLHPHNSISNVVASVIHDDKKYKENHRCTKKHETIVEDQRLL